MSVEKVPQAEQVDSPATPAPPERKTVEAWAAARETPRWAFAGARQLSGWAEGRELTAAEYDKAIEAFRNLRSQ